MQFFSSLDPRALQALDFFDEARAVHELPRADELPGVREAQLAARLREPTVDVNELLQRTVRAVDHESS